MSSSKDSSIKQELERNKARLQGYFVTLAEILQNILNDVTIPAASKKDLLDEHDKIYKKATALQGAFNNIFSQLLNNFPADDRIDLVKNSMDGLNERFKIVSGAQRMLRMKQEDDLRKRREKQDLQRNANFRPVSIQFSRPSVDSTVFHEPQAPPPIITQRTLPLPVNASTQVGSMPNPEEVLNNTNPPIAQPQIRPRRSLPHMAQDLFKNRRSKKKDELPTNPLPSPTDNGPNESPASANQIFQPTNSRHIIARQEINQPAAAAENAPPSTTGIPTQTATYFQRAIDRSRLASGPSPTASGNNVTSHNNEVRVPHAMIPGPQPRYHRPLPPNQNMSYTQSEEQHHAPTALSPPPFRRVPQGNLYPRNVGSGRGVSVTQSHRNDVMNVADGSMDLNAQVNENSGLMSPYQSRVVSGHTRPPLGAGSSRLYGDSSKAQDGEERQDDYSQYDDTV